MNSIIPNLTDADLVEAIMHEIERRRFSKIAKLVADQCEKDRLTLLRNHDTSREAIRYLSNEESVFRSVESLLQEYESETPLADRKT